MFCQHLINHVDVVDHLGMSPYSLGLATVGLETVGLATVGLATLGLATVGLATSLLSHIYLFAALLSCISWRL